MILIALGAMTDMRLRATRRLLDSVRQPLDILLARTTATVAEDDAADISFCRANNEDSITCQQIILGSAIMELSRLGLWPIPAAEAYSGSIKKLHTALRDFKTVSFPEKSLAPHCRHHVVCGLPFELPEMDNTIDLEGSMLEDFESNGQQTGLIEDDCLLKTPRARAETEE